jgi:2-polyprenyl-3-methyl-5-hydroxy-6-metoxy-1,4-benzoquinol methylase
MAPQLKVVRVLLLLLAIAAALPAQQPASEDAAWKHYYAWLQQGNPREKTPANYRAQLISEGLSEAQAGERIALLRTLVSRHREELTALNFNRVYTAPKPPFNTRPNAFLVSVAEDLKPGAALDVAMGQGRNALYLATHGWTVTGFDIADQGLAVAQAEAARQGVKITTVKSNYQNFDFGEQKWDLVVFSYAWAPLADPALVRRVRDSLKPGGIVVIEAPAEDPLKPVHLREWPPEPADAVNALVKVWIDGFRILRYEDTQAMCDWRNRNARILRLLAKKW